jgi:periplasmic protein TonB
MTFAARSVLPDRTFGLLCSFSIHVVLGAALLAWAHSGPSGARGRQGKESDLIVVELQPLPPDERRNDMFARKKAAPQSERGGAKLASVLQAPTNRDRHNGAAGDTVGAMPGKAENGANEASQPADGAPAMSGADIQLFRAHLLRHIERFRRYPPEAQQAGIEGTVRIHFVMDQSGQVKDIWIEMSSGARVLDDEAVAAILRARPLPAPPAGWPASFGVSLPIGYDLK